MIKPKAINYIIQLIAFVLLICKIFWLVHKSEKKRKSMWLITGQNQELWILLSRCTEGCNPFVPKVQEVANILLGSRDKVPGRLRAAAIAQLRDVSSLNTGYFLTIKAGFMAASLQFSARTQRKETTKWN